MVRNYERKTARAKTPPDIMLKAVRAVKLNNQSIRQVAEKFNINYRTLTRYCKKIPEEELLCENITTPTISVGYVKVRQTFTNFQEQELVNYIQHASDIYFNLSTKEVKKLAYNLALYNSVKMPESWIRNKMAGDEWLNALMKRHNDLPIRKAETSKARETSFSKTNVELFYKNLEKLMSCYHFQPENIWNMDEIRITTLETPDRIIIRSDQQQFKNTISATHGNLVTVACTISAKGDHMPPFFVFPHQYLKDYFIASASAEISGTVNRSSWMGRKDFEKFLRHFYAHAKCSNEKPVLLLLNQQSSHISIESLNYTKENGIVMLSFPQNCSHKLQPLNKIIFECLKEHVNSASNAWLLNNPNHAINIHNISEIVAVAYPLAMTPINIQAGFKCTGIFPFNNDVFSDWDFQSDFISDELPLKNIVTMKIIDKEQHIKEDMIKVETASFCSSECDISESFPEESDEVFKTSSDEEKEKVEDLHSSKAGPQKSPKYAKKQVATAVIDIAERRKLELENIENKDTNKRKSIKILLKETNKETKNENSAKKFKKIKQVTKCKKITKKKKSLKEKECFCTICLKPDPDSLSKEKWVHCTHCKEWSHKACISVISCYTCRKCKS